MLTSDLILRNVFTAYLSRSILSVVAAFGPWSSGYGLPPLEFQTASPRTILQVADQETTHLLCYSAHILHAAPTSSLVQISELAPEEEVPTALPSEHLGTLPTEAVGDTAMSTLSPDTAAPFDAMLSLAPTTVSMDGSPIVSHGPLEDDSDLGLAQVLSDVPGPSAARPRRSKYKAPVVTTEVRRYTRSTRFDGFRVPQISDVRPTVSKVKPRVIPSAAPSSSTVIMDQAPPPTPFRTMQDIGIIRCAVPPQELTEAALLASDDTATIHNSPPEGSSSSSA